MNKGVVITFLFFLAFWVVFGLFQNKTIYNKSLGKISQNWVHDDTGIYQVNEPYTAFKDTNIVHWDAVHYNLMSRHGYDVDKAGGDYIFAFFPFFPLLWKLSMLPPSGIVFLNFLLFALSLFLMEKLFREKEGGTNVTNYLVAISLPSIIVFFIPYTEATFMLTCIIGFYGLAHKKYAFYFLGFFLAALTRPSFTFLALSLVCVEFFVFIGHKKILAALRSMFFKVLPLLMGTLVVSFYQSIQKGGSFTKFLDVRKYWDNGFSIPHNLSDWSHESFGINIGVLFMVAIPVLMILFQLVAKQLKRLFSPADPSELSPKKYLEILSLTYISGAFMFVLLFRAGSLHDFYRFVVCTPFFVFLLFYSFNSIQAIPLQFRIFLFGVLAMVGLFVLGLSNYSTYWNFSDFGFFVFVGAIFFWILQDLDKNRWYKWGLFALIFSNVVWTTYLFNTYLANGWIFA